MSSRSLPSRTAPRSRPAGRPGRDEGDHARPPARSPLPSGPRMAQTSEARHQGRSQTSRERTNDTRSHSSPTSSFSSSGSSFLDRMKVRGDTSSRTSLEDYYEEPPKRGGGWASGRNRKPQPPREELYDEEDAFQDSTPAQPTSGHGYDLWGRVTAVAGNLTVNVSKAWEKGIHVADGEETPSGQESRLTKAMKAYHLDRARSPADLPAWLFDEHERGVAPKSWRGPKSEEYEDRSRSDPEPPRQRGGLRDIYDKTTVSAPPVSRRAPSSLSDTATSDAGSSRATNRLKAIREAKRSALQTYSEPPEEDRKRVQANPSESAGARAPPARMGLPSGPGRGRRQ